MVAVTVTDGHVVSKNEVYVKIINTTATTPSGIASNPPIPPGFRPANVPNLPHGVPLFPIPVPPNRPKLPKPEPPVKKTERPQNEAKLGKYDIT